MAIWLAPPVSYELLLIYLLAAPTPSTSGILSLCATYQGNYPSSRTLLFRAGYGDCPIITGVWLVAKSSLVPLFGSTSMIDNLLYAGGQSWTYLPLTAVMHHFFHPRHNLMSAISAAVVPRGTYRRVPRVPWNVLSAISLCLNRKLG